MARTKMRVDTIEIAHHLAALGAFDGPSHAAHLHKDTGQFKSLHDWLSVHLEVQFQKATTVNGRNINANTCFRRAATHR